MFYLKPVWAIIHIYMEVPQENSLRSYLRQAKMSFFFPLIKSENRRVEHVLSGIVGTSGGGRRWGKDARGRIWCKYCVHMYVNGKMIPVETVLGMGGREDKEECLRE
jgi:hypothetical protein